MTFAIMANPSDSHLRGDCHFAPDEDVFAAYDWPSDLSDGEIAVFLS